MRRMSRAPPLQAPLTLLPLPRPLMTGEVLDAGWRLFRSGLLRTLPYSGLAVLVLELPTLYSALFGDGTFFAIAHFRGGALPSAVSQLVGLSDSTLVLLGALLLAVPMLGVITLRLNSISRGERPRFRREIITALRRWPAALIATLAAFGFPLLLYGVASVINPFLALETMIVLSVPMMWPMALFVVALPAFWCDGLGPLAAIGRAAGISRRRTWRIIGAILATGCVVAVFYVLSAIVTGVMGSLFAGADLVLMAMVRSLLGLVIGAFGVPFVLAVLVVAYEDLKLRDAERRGVRG
jgi:hypothetical protein